MMKKIRIKPFGTLAIFLLASTSCVRTEALLEEFDDKDDHAPQKISLSASVKPVPGSRVFWTEDAYNTNSTTLLFNWEDDKTGSMKTIVLSKNGIKPFTEGIVANTFISTTEERLKSSLNITSPLTQDGFFEQEDNIHCFYPVDENNSTLEPTSGSIHYAFSTPTTIVQDKPNSTRHLSPYIYMKGKGNVDIAGKEASSEVKFNLLPAVIQYHITNSESQPLTINSIRLEGELATKGLLYMSNGTENLTFTEQQHTIELKSKLTIQPNEVVNFYILLLPTQFTEKEHLVFNMEGTYANGWTANYTRIPIDCQQFTSENRFESNKFYTLDIDVTRDEIAINLGNININHAQEGENTQIEIGPKN